jgi:predicted RNA methylase
MAREIKLSKHQANILFENGGKVYDKLKATNISLYSSTPYKQARLVCVLIRSLYKDDLKGQTILDANSNIGGDFMELAKLGCRIYGVELDTYHFNMLKHNVSLLLGGYTNISLMNTNIIKFLQKDLPITIAFFDPPWRDEFKVATRKNKELAKRGKKEIYQIPLYYEYKSTRYYMADVINMSSFETVIIKAPQIYDRTELRNLVSRYFLYVCPIRERRGDKFRILYNLLLLTTRVNRPDTDHLKNFIASVNEDLRWVVKGKPFANTE